ncbi:MAG: hypothetical protein RMN51_06305 [Verrucomicrobiota bacterium]|nr:hypothetical protein [Limisphaera sp.]MDW8381703.1 hypothetical protein [Verrucomicrobiota bacterium]
MRMVLGRLLLATGAVRRVSGRESAYRLRNQLPWPAFSAEAGPRIRSRPGSEGAFGAGPVNRLATDSVDQAGNERRGPLGRSHQVSVKSPRLDRAAENRDSNNPGSLGFIRSAMGAGGRLVRCAETWVGARRWWCWEAREQMELPLRREAALARVQVLRNDLRDTEEEIRTVGGNIQGLQRRGLTVAGGALRRLRQLLDALALRLAGQIRV